MADKITFKKPVDFAGKTIENLTLPTDAVSVSATGTSTEEVSYITINGNEKKLAGGGGSSAVELERAKAIGGIAYDNPESSLFIEWDGRILDKEIINLSTLPTLGDFGFGYDWKVFGSSFIVKVSDKICTYVDPFDHDVMVPRGAPYFPRSFIKWASVNTNDTEVTPTITKYNVGVWKPSFNNNIIIVNEISYGDAWWFKGNECISCIIVLQDTTIDNVLLHKGTWFVYEDAVHFTKVVSIGNVQTINDSLLDHRQDYLKAKEELFPERRYQWDGVIGEKFNFTRTLEGQTLKFVKISEELPGLSTCSEFNIETIINNALEFGIYNRGSRGTIKYDGQESLGCWAAYDGPVSAEGAGLNLAPGFICLGQASWYTEAFLGVYVAMNETNEISKGMYFISSSGTYEGKQFEGITTDIYFHSVKVAGSNKITADAIQGDWDSDGLVLTSNGLNGPCYWAPASTSSLNYSETHKGTVNITNGKIILTSGNVTSLNTFLDSDEEQTYTIQADEGYLLPTAVTVSGCTGSIQGSTLTVKNSTADNWTANISCLKTFTISYTLTNVNVSGEQPTSIKEAETKTINFVASAGYTLPDSISVSGCTYTWNKAKGKLVLSNATSNVSISISGAQSGYNMTIDTSGLTRDDRSTTYYSFNNGSDWTDFRDAEAGTFNNISQIKFKVAQNLTSYRYGIIEMNINGRDYNWDAQEGEYTSDNFVLTQNGSGIVSAGDITPTETYPITWNLTNCEAVDPPETISTEDDIYVEINPTTGFGITEDDINVENCSSAWDASSNELNIFEPSGPVTITIEAREIESYPITWNLTHCSVDEEYPTISTEGEHYITVNPNVGYDVVAADIVVENCQHEWDPENKELYIHIPTGPVTITINAHQAQSYPITWNLNNCTASPQPETIQEADEVWITITPDEGYILPDSIQVTGCTSEWLPEDDEDQLGLLNANSNVSVTINAPQIQSYPITWNLSNCTATPQLSSIQDGGDEWITITPNKGYILPESIQVTGCSNEWDSELEEDQLNIWEPTGPVSITIACEEEQ